MSNDTPTSSSAGVNLASPRASVNLASPNAGVILAPPNADVILASRNAGVILASPNAGVILASSKVEGNNIDPVRAGTRVNLASSKTGAGMAGKAPEMRTPIRAKLKHPEPSKYTPRRRYRSKRPLKEISNQLKISQMAGVKILSSGQEERE